MGTHYRKGFIIRKHRITGKLQLVYEHGPVEKCKVRRVSRLIHTCKSHSLRSSKTGKEYALSLIPVEDEISNSNVNFGHHLLGCSCQGSYPKIVEVST